MGHGSLQQNALPSAASLHGRYPASPVLPADPTSNLPLPRLRLCAFRSATTGFPVEKIGYPRLHERFLSQRAVGQDPGGWHVTRHVSYRAMPYCLPQMRIRSASTYASSFRGCSVHFRYGPPCPVSTFHCLGYPSQRKTSVAICRLRFDRTGLPSSLLLSFRFLLGFTLAFLAHSHHLNHHMNYPG